MFIIKIDYYKEKLNGKAEDSVLENLRFVFVSKYILTLSLFAEKFRWVILFALRLTLLKCRNVKINYSVLHKERKRIMID